MRVITSRVKIENLIPDELFAVGNTLYRYVGKSNRVVFVKKEHPEKGYEDYIEQMVFGVNVTLFSIEGK